MSKQIFSLFISFFLLSCGYNHEPIIQSLIADPEVVEPGGIIIYTWDATAGTILQDYGGSTASWTAPAILGIFSISCILEDPDHGTDIAMVNVTVQ